MFRNYIKNDDFLTAEIFTNDNYEELITNVYNVLESLDYVGRVKTVEFFQRIFAEGALNNWFYDVASWLCFRLGRVKDCISVNSEEILRAAFMEETLINNPRSFLIEMSSLLNVLQCPIKQLTSGLIEERLKLAQNQLLIIDYLIEELNIAKTAADLNPKVKKEIEVVELEESRIATELRVLFLALKFSRPPNDSKAAMVFSKIDKRLCSLSQPLLPENLLQEALLSGSLNISLWYSLERMYGEFYAEYRNHREMDMNRVSAIIYSFMWNERLEMQGALQDRQKISGGENTASGGSEATADRDVQISNVIAATADLTFGETASCGPVFQIPRVALYRVPFSQMPFQRGRSYQQTLPPPGVPIWQQPRSNHRGRMPFTVSRSRAPARPVKVVAPLTVGDHFPQFGNVPVVMGQHGLCGAPLIINQGVQVAPVSGGNFQYQHGWGVPQGGFVPFSGHIPFGGRGSFDSHAFNNVDFSRFGGHANADYGPFSGHAFDNADYGPFSGHAFDNADEALFSGHAFDNADQAPFSGHAFDNADQAPFSGHAFDNADQAPFSGHAFDNADQASFSGHAFDNADQSPFSGHEFDNADQAPFGGRAYNADQGLFGDRGQYNNPMHYEGPLFDQGRGDHIQDRGQQVRRVQFGDGRGYLEGFGGFCSHGGDNNRGFGY